MKTKVVKVGGEWAVEFGYGSQSFVLPTVFFHHNKRIEAVWLKHQLDECFERYKEELLSQFADWWNSQNPEEWDKITQQTINEYLKHEKQTKT